MCGICGYFGFENQDYARPELLKKMCEVMAHRGPDDEGFYFKDKIGLGSRRLSIIDLAGGHQPMPNEDGTIWVVFNGEIYNYSELRALLSGKGHKFSTYCDTEIILHLYEEFGSEGVERLRGMFAFGIWDEKSNELLLARDNLGIKPLYYAILDRYIIFSSSINAILQDNRIERFMDLSALDDFLTFRYVPAPKTLLQGIKKLLPGHILVCKDGAVETKKYWDFEFGLDERDKAYYTNQLREKVWESVEMQLMSDVPLGAFLSGGLDSSIIVGLMSQMIDEPINTFSVGFAIGKPYDELEYAREVAKSYSTNHREILIEPDILELMPKLIYFMEEPIADPAAIPTYYLSKLAHDYGVKVILTGEGADEMFGGYKRYYWAKVADRLQWLPAKAKRSIMAVLAHIPVSTSHKQTIQSLLSTTNLDFYLAGVSVFDEQEKSLLYSNDLKCLLNGNRASSLQPYLSKSRNLFSMATYVDMKLWLSDDLLIKMDKMSMAHSVETRVPFLDHKLVEFSATIPEHLKYKGSVSKYILRQAMADILPKSVRSRKKHAFAVPIAEWLRNELKDYARDILLSKTSIDRGYFNPARVEEIVDEHQTGKKDHSFKIWSLLNLELWHRIYIDKPQILSSA